MSNVKQVADVTSNSSWITESGLRKVDSVLYHGRRVILIGACILPLVVLLSEEIALMCYACFAIIGLIAAGIFPVLEAIKVGNTRATLGMNICNKIVAYSFPLSVGPATALELMPMTNSCIGLIIGLASSIGLALFVYPLLDRTY